jgi:hypothetical protein
VPSIGELNLDLVASTARFKGGIDEATKSLTTFADHAKKKHAETESGFNKVTESIAKLGEKLKWAGEILGVFWVSEKAIEGVKQLYEGLEHTAGSVDKIGKAASRLGVGVEQLSALKFAAEQSGVGFDTLTNLLQKGERNIAEFTAEGGGPAKRALAEIGVSLLDSSGHIRNMVDLLPDLARGIGEVGDNARQLQLSEKIFGRGNGEQFVQLIREMGENFGDLAEKEALAQKLGVVFTPEQYETAKKYKEAVEQVGAAWFGIKVKVLDAIGPLLTRWHEDLSKFIASVPEVAGNLVTKIREAFGGGEAQDLARWQFSEFWRAIKDYAITAIADLGAILAPNMGRVAFALGDVAGDAIGKAIVSAAISAVGSASKLAVTSLTNYGMSETVAKTLLGPFGLLADYGDKIKAVAAEVNLSMVPAMTMFRTDMRLTKEEQDDVARGWTVMKTDLGILGGEVSDAAEKLFGFGAAWEKLGEKARKARADIKPPNTDSKEWGEFTTGYAQGFHELEIRSQDFTGFGKAIATEFGDLSDGIAHSLTQTLLHAQKFWQGLKDTFAKVGEMVIETALKFITLRAVVAGVAGVSGLFAPSAGASAGAGDAYGSSSIGTFAARGAVFGGGQLIPFASGGIITRPTVFPMANGSALTGEAGPEAVMPLTRVNGMLGVRAAGGGGDVTVQIIDQRQSGAQPQVSQSTGPDGRKMIQVLIRDEVSRSFSSGEMDRVMTANYGLSRAGIKR